MLLHLTCIKVRHVSKKRLGHSKDQKLSSRLIPHVSNSRGKGLFLGELTGQKPMAVSHCFDIEIRSRGVTKTPHTSTVEGSGPTALRASGRNVRPFALAVAAALERLMILPEVMRRPKPSECENA